MSAERHNKYLRRYQEARKRWIKELYNQEILGQFNMVKCKVVEVLPGDGEFVYRWGHEKWISKLEYDAGSYKDTHCIDQRISKYDLAYFMLCGWARKTGREIPPKDI